MVSWNPLTKNNERRHLVYGESDAGSSDEILADLAEGWRYLLSERAPVAAPEAWDAILTGVIIDRGQVSFSPIRSDPSLQQELLSQAAGCSLTFRRVQDQLEGEFETDDLFEQACAEQLQRFCDALLPAFEACCCALASDHPLRGRSFAYKVIVSPDPRDLPILQTRLTVT